MLAKYYFNLTKPYNILIKEVIFFSSKEQEATQAKQEQYQGMTGLLMF